jgi:double-stranded uracil-DNA glycosylase
MSTQVERAAAANQTVPDLIAPGLRVLFCGINPGLLSGATGHHFARPGNRFWPALHGAGFTERLLRPSEEHELLRAGYGITCMVARATATAAELTAEEIVAGGRRLVATVEHYQPRCVAILGLSVYRTAFDRPRATIGPQEERVGGALALLLPNPSGLNAHYKLPDLVRLYRDLRIAIEEQGM